MTLTPDIAKSIVAKLHNSKTTLSKNINLKEQHNKYAYCFELYDSPPRHIAITRNSNNKDSVTIYVNKMSIHNISFCNSIIGSYQISEKYSDGNIKNNEENDLASSLAVISSLNPKNNDVLRLTISTKEDFQLILIWYLGLPFDKKILTQFLLTRKYKFPDSPFEISSDKPIATKDLNRTSLKDYLEVTYEVCDKVFYHQETIEAILGKNRAINLIELNKSEYFKVLTHFSILSKVKRGWFDLLVAGPNRTSPPSLSDSPSEFFTTKEVKKINDGLINCYYSRLVQGMTDQEKQKYRIFRANEYHPTCFDILLLLMDQAIQLLFCYVQQNIFGYYDKNLMPDTDLDETIEEMQIRINKHFAPKFNERYYADTLRASLIKMASINIAINQIEANINIQLEYIRDLPFEIEHFKNISSELDILPAISKIFNTEQNKLPKKLIECSKLVCRMYIYESSCYKERSPDYFSEFSNFHLKPFNIAVSAALLCQDCFGDKKLCLNIRGETNKNILVYKTLSDLLTKVSPNEELAFDSLIRNGCPNELFKYLSSRYSILVRSLSGSYPSVSFVEAHMKVRRKKFELQLEAYELLKDLSVQAACLKIESFCLEVNSICAKVGIN